MCMGVTAGAYILTLFAVKYRQRVLGLILVSPLCRAPSWTEWLYNKVMSNILYFYGMCAVIKEMLVKRYFGKEARGNSTLVSESDIVLACKKVSSLPYHVFYFCLERVLFQNRRFIITIFTPTLHNRE